MRTLKELFERNRAWAEAIRREDPEFFPQLATQQNPRYLWIGCSDSRVPANQIVGLRPGEIFVHRNVANLVVHTDLNCLSVIHFAVESLRVEHVIVCGHYGCGGVTAASAGEPMGLIDNWLRHIQDIETKHEAELVALGDPRRRLDRLCELNVREQMLNVCRTSIVQDAWRAGRKLSVHGWVYDLHDGLLRDLGLCVGGFAELEEALRGDRPPAS